MLKQWCTSNYQAFSGDGSVLSIPFAKGSIMMLFHTTTKQHAIRYGLHAKLDLMDQTGHILDPVTFPSFKSVM
jgi:hypothetical protein